MSSSTGTDAERVVARRDPRDVVLSVSGLGKRFDVYGQPHDRLLQSLFGGRRCFYKEFWALRDVSFEARRGETIGIVGRNGSGKSTLLQLIAGTLTPTTGLVQMKGRITALLELGAGFNPEFSGRENVYMYGTILGLDKVDIDSRYDTIAAFADIGDFIEQPIKTYSSGMTVRLAFAVSACLEPDILIVDEALAVGDASFQAKCFARIKNLQAAGCTLLYVTHAVESVTKHCDRALFLDDGRLAMDGKPASVTNAYLDHLFGRRSATYSTDRSQERLNPAFAEDTVEHYHERAGYRQEEHRFGVGGARIVDYFVEVGGKPYPQSAPANALLRIVAKVVFEQDVVRPVFGLLLKTHDGIFLYGTNSDLCSTEGRPPSVKKGDIVECEFQFPLRLNTGSYLLSLGVSSEMGSAELTALDRRYDSIMLHVAHVTGFWGIADLNAEFSIAEPSRGARVP